MEEALSKGHCLCSSICVLKQLPSFNHQIFPYFSLASGNHNITTKSQFTNADIESMFKKYVPPKQVNLPNSLMIC